MNTVPKIKQQITDSDKNIIQVFLVAGEASSDQHAALLVEELLRLSPQAEVFGMGGSRLREVGMRTIVDTEKAASVMGFVELLGSVKKLLKARKVLIDQVDKVKPQLAILVDFPDFNLSLAKKLHQRGIKIFYFISPQLWAWRLGRVKIMKKYIDRIGAIFPFEEAFYRQHGIEAHYVGHPFLDRQIKKNSADQQDNQSRLNLLSSWGVDPQRPIVALLPGSRKSEVEKLLPEMLEAYLRLRSARTGLQAIIPVAHTLDFEWVKDQTRNCPELFLVPGSAPQVLEVATVAVVTSGTATVEAALAQIPFVVVYKLSALSYFIGKLLISGVKYIAMPNLIAGRKIVQELIQEQASADRIVQEVEVLLGDSIARGKMRENLQVVEDRLRSVGNTESAGVRAAKLALELVR